MFQRWFPTLVLSLALALAGVPASAQTGSARSALSGVVTDATGGAIPGATVVVKNNATGVTSTAVTNSAGAFAVPSLDIGTYTVTVALSGFKTAVVNDVVLIVGNPSSVEVALEVGNLSETVEVRASSELIQTQATAVTSTISATQIQNLPLTSRNALFGFVIMLPGVDSASGQTPRDAKLYGLPEQAINITIDGINTQNNFQRATDGFYSMVFPQLDALEQVTVTGAAAGSDSASGGSVSIRFVTRSGTNSYRGTGYYFLRHPKFNTNYHFNEVNDLPKNRLVMNQVGGSFGGPIKLMKYDGSGRAFFFANYEEFYQPTSATRTRTMFHPDVEKGLFRYAVSGGVQSVNVLAVAGANGHASAMDPTVGALIAEIRNAANSAVSAGTGVIQDVTTNPAQQQLLYQPPGKYYNHLPTTRVDFNLSEQHRLSGSYWWQQINRIPDIQNGGEPEFPGLPNVADYRSLRTVGSVTLRSTFGANIVNELVGGWQDSPGTFNHGVRASQFANQGSFALNFPLGVTDATRSTGEASRYQDNWSLTNTVSWIKGSHNMSLGGGYSHVGQWNKTDTVVPTLSFGIQTGLDPADSMFTTANFPGASTTVLNNARALYAFLTGRVTQVAGTARLDEQTLRYTYNGTDNVRGTQDEVNLFFQDSWRVRPNVTLNFGLAWIGQFPMKAGNGVLSTTDYAGFCGPYGIGADGRCKLFQVGGEQTGVTPMFNQYSADASGYETDLNNVAPNVGVAWRPDVQEGWLRSLLGDPDTATLRAGYSITYDRPSIGDFTGLFGGNPGRTYGASRNNTGSEFLLVGNGETWPVLFSDRNRLGPPAGIPDGPTYPIAATVSNSLSIFDPNIQVPFTHSFSAGFQRSLTDDMAIEVRYVGTRGRNAWATENWNETNVLSNGFLQEFRNAQTNLLAHVAQGCGVTGGPACSFAYRGPGTGTVPLPVYLAYLTGTPTGLAGDAARYTASLFTNTTFLGRFGVYEPEVLASAQTDLQTTARRANALAAGLPANFFRMNPAVGTNNVNFRTSPGESRYDSVVVEVRRRLSDGLLLNASFTKSWWWDSVRDTLQYPQVMVRSTNAVPNSFKFTANWDIPVGQGRRFGSNSSAWLNGVIGNWAVNAIARVQSGRQLTVTGSRLVGMTRDELQGLFKVREDSATGFFYMLPEDIILNTRRAFETSATSASGYGALGVPEGRYIAPASVDGCVQVYPGDCAERNIFLSGPIWSRLDLNFKKTFPFGASRANFQLGIDVLNVFDRVNFNPVFNPGSGDIFRVTSGYTDISQSYDPGGRLMQLAFRVNW